MRHRSFVVWTLTLGLALCATCGRLASAQNAPSTSASGEDAKLLRLLDRAWQEQLARDPTLRTSLRIPGRKNIWTPITDERDSQDALRARHDLGNLHRSIDFAGLSSARRLDYAVYEEILQNRIRLVEYHRRTYFFTRNTADPYLAVPQILISAREIKTAQDARDYISQMKGLRTLLDDAVVGTAARTRRGIILPAFNFEDIAKNSRAFIAGRPCDDGPSDQSLWADFRTKLQSLPLKDDERKRLVDDASAALRELVCPAYRKFADTFIEMGKGVTRNDGLWSLPGGDQLYRDAIALHTSVELDPAQLHHVGLQEVDRIETALREIMARVGFNGSIGEFFESLRKDTRFQFPQTEQGRADYLEAVRRVIDRTQSRLPELFSTMSHRPIVVRPVEKARERYLGTAAFYEPPPGDVGPGTFYIGLADMSRRPSWEIEPTTYHEALPGHHLQMSLAAEIPDISEWRRHYQNDSYVEGWALYAEGLGADLGGYLDDYARAARYQLELLRAVRIVVETGFHHERWSWERCAAYLAEHQGLPLETARVDVTRYMVWPGQGVSYTVGELEIKRLREKAQRALGPKFDVRAFHSVILDTGVLPFALLEQLVDSWISAVKGAS